MNKTTEDGVAIDAELGGAGIQELDTFATDLDKGLSGTPKSLSSRYFYDSAGDRLFQRIMQLDEYYLTRTEYSILDRYKEDLLRKFSSEPAGFHLLEFGAGDGYKTKILLRHFAGQQANFDYRPIDISAGVLNELQNSLQHEIPSIQVKGMQGEYFEALEQMQEADERRKVVLFLGSNIGNFTLQQAVDFLSRLRKNLNPGDKLLIGFDLKKDPHLIRQAYDDPQGVTRDFNLNLLRRINRELGANFRLNNFKHFQSYNPTSGECRSYLISLEHQRVFVNATGKTYFFKKWEPIHVEVSRKFDLETIEEIAGRCGFQIEENHLDEKEYFVDSLWTA